MFQLSDIFTEPLYIAIAIGVVFILFVIIKRAGKMPYVACDALLTKSELHFYRTLKQAIPVGTLICMKVRMGDLITCSDAQWRSGWGPRVSAKHIDFVLIDAQTTAIKLAIELDDSTHRTNADRIARDKFVNKAFSTAGVPLLRVNTSRQYDIADIRSQINQSNALD